MISAFNKAHRLVEFPTGSYVIVKDLLASTPLDPKSDDPYNVVRRTPREARIGNYTQREREVEDDLDSFYGSVVVKKHKRNARKARAE
ncbi:hypothetical protein BGZ89_006079, partial [Linnemannia elongata]